MTTDTPGLSPTAQGLAHRITVATWVYRWGFSSDFVIQRLLQKQATGWAAHATKRKLLRATSTASGVPRRLYTLATQGLELACQHSPKLLDYKEQDPLAINQATIRHELFCQHLALSMLRGSGTKHVLSGREWSPPAEARLKCPDFVVETPEGRKVGVEVELSAKFGRRLDEFVGDTLNTLSDEAGFHQLDGFLIVSDIPALLERYKLAFTAGNLLRTWKKDQRGHWRIKSELAVRADQARLIRYLSYKTDRL